MCAQAFRHSLGCLKEESNFSLKTKGPNSAKGGASGTPKTRDLRTKQDKVTVKATVPCKIPEEMEMSAEVNVQS